MAKTQKTLLTTRQIMAAFAVSDMTVWTWRQGTATRDPLPIVQDGRHVYFDAKEMAKYAKQHGLNFNLDVGLKVETAASGGTKPGPKAGSGEKKAAPASKAVKPVAAKKTSSAPAGKKVVKKSSKKPSVAAPKFGDTGSAATAAVH